MQPNLQIFNMGDPDYRWVGNEAGLAPMPCWNTVEAVPFSIESKIDEKIARPTWLPAECDARIRYKGWCWAGPQDPLKSLEELMGLYYYSVGRGCNLLLNVGPKPSGLMNADDVSRLAEFGAEIRRRFHKPIAAWHSAQPAQGQWTQQTATRWEYAPDAPFLVDHVVLEEDLTNGEHVRRFAIGVTPAPEGRPVTLYEGSSIGHKAICRFPLVKAQKLTVELTENAGSAIMRGIALHCATC